MRNIKITKFYMDKLSNTEELLLVQQYLSTFDEWYYLNDCVFFREYTDHGVSHINEVLSTVEKLLTKESKDNFSSADCALLICSTLLHDFAMHLQEESFVKLVDSKSSPVGSDDFGDKSWNCLWKEYVSEIHRLPENERMNLFGLLDPISPPDLGDIENWKASQYRYIGEFIRRYHPRLAYEITRNGIPGAKGKLPIDQIREDDPNYRLSMLSGVIARSHGMKLRDTFHILERDYHLRVFEPNSHPIYVMVLLRIADYVQLQSSRAPGRLLKIKRLKSPLSQSEWGLHDAIQGVSFDAEPDPEVLRIQVDPRKSDIVSYLKTKRLLANIQYELDSSWAVLGEVYGRFPNENWGMTIRRIRSNTENQNSFGRAAGFIPEEVKFTSANTELTKLLIKPLYGDYPEIAVRELIQNAIDACRERAFFENVRDENDLDKYYVKVELINNSDGTSTLRVSDTGIGMTLDVLKNYFLKAGSSFRTSLAWKKQFANDRSKSEVLRTGRFGVGALAAFLIADDPSEIHLTVHSRHVNAKPAEAVSFDTTLSDAPISVYFKEKSEIGTSISVTTASPPFFMRTKESEEKEGESWDWYCLDWPRVERSLSTGKVLPQKYRIPSKSVEKQSNNFRPNFIEVKGFDSVCWYFGEGHQVVCNGIRVIKKEKYRNSLPNLFEAKTILGPQILNFPNISVMDKDGIFPLTLDRLRLDFDQIPFMRELREDVLFSFVSGLAVSAPNAISENSFNLAEENLGLILKKFEGMDRTSIAWVILNGRISPFSNRSINQLKGKRIIELYSTEDLGFVKSPEECALILTKKSIFGSIRNVTNSSKYLYFLSDSHARERLDRLVGTVQRGVEFEKYHYDDHMISISEVNKIRKEFHEYIQRVMKITNYNKAYFDMTLQIFDKSSIVSKDEYNSNIRLILRNIYENFGRHQSLGELFSSFEKKLRYSYLDDRDGRIMLDVVTAITDAVPRLKEIKSKDFLPIDCPVYWDEIEKNLNQNNEDWFMGSWILKDDVNLDAGFIGDAWYSLFGRDFIPLSSAERDHFFDTINSSPATKKHLSRWLRELRVN
ncbi:HD domain-containing protein [Pectobacterium zantedeschiae]|uniref:HD-CE domain-containing protein n=1 Tax=Pectobacterium zantedeschiae TaxID=2034769 RepID=A0A9X8P6Y4_9GAMM|nr:ATP-binding protein [Pectobacterium zantedeschiae]RYC37497.1 hypothetical protein CTN06_21640 [Pectobacterium zantedeschiae]RYC45984.1 hypothetical protein CLR69_13810 [Pectobacterium zantedeschiae]